MISLKDVSRDYANEFVRTAAVSAVSLQIGQGEYCAIMGPSGCGKSTLLSILGLMDPAFRGNYVLDGLDIGAASPAALRHARNALVGYVFQSFNLIDDITVLDNILLPKQFSPAGMQAEDRAAAVELARRFGIGERLQHLPYQLSGGQQQRVAIARALICRPKVIFADEPTGNLDSSSTGLIMDIFEEINAGGTTVVVVTHDPQVARRAGRLIQMGDGKVLES